MPVLEIIFWIQDIVFFSLKFFTPSFHVPKMLYDKGSWKAKKVIFGNFDMCWPEDIWMCSITLSPSSWSAGFLITSIIRDKSYKEPNGSYRWSWWIKTGKAANIGQKLDLNWLFWIVVNFFAGKFFASTESIFVFEERLEKLIQVLFSNKLALI